MALSMIKTTIGTQNIMTNRIIMIILAQTLKNKRIIKEQTMKNRGIRNSRTNRSTPRKESLEREKMIIRKNDGPVSRPWKVNLS